MLADALMHGRNCAWAQLDVSYDTLSIEAIAAMIQPV